MTVCNGERQRIFSRINEYKRIKGIVFSSNVSVSHAHFFTFTNKVWYPKVTTLVKFSPLQLSSAIKDRENSWKKQKSELEDHYAKLMNDLHNRTQVRVLQETACYLKMVHTERASVVLWCLSVERGETQKANA